MDQISEDEQEFNKVFDELSQADGATQKGAEEVEEVVDTKEAAASETENNAQDQEEMEDLWSGLSEDQLARISALEKEKEKALMDQKAAAGRVSYMQKQMNSMSKAPSQTQPAQNTDEQPSNAQVQEAMQTPEGWAAFKDEYPEIGDAIDHRLSGQQGEITKVIEERLAPITSKIQSDAVSQAEAQLEALHPGYQDILAAPDFSKWLNEQPHPVQLLAESYDAFEASTLINFYKQTLPPTEQDDGNTAVKNKIKQKRSAQMSASKGIQTRSSASPKGQVDDDDFDGEWDRLAAQDR